MQGTLGHNVQKKWNNKNKCVDCIQISETSIVSNRKLDKTLLKATSKINRKLGSQTGLGFRNIIQKLLLVFEKTVTLKT